MSQKLIDMEKPYITDPIHGGKITCHKCCGFITEMYPYVVYSPGVYFHYDHYNGYEHYYGLDKPID